MRPRVWFLSFLTMLLGLFVGRGVAQTNNVYIAQAAAGSANGSSCANAYAYTYFNTSGNWTSGTPSGAQIGPGTTVHLCGTFSAPANACNYLTIQGSGSSGNPITVHFEPGSVLTAPTWGAGCGAIYSTGHSYITIDGGNSGSAVAGCPAACSSTLSGGGTIQATANGTGLAYQINGNGILTYNCSYCTFENLIVSNIYVHTCTLPVTNCTDEHGDPTGAIFIDGGSNVLVTNNLAHDMKWCIEHNFNNGDSNITFSNNYVYNIDHGFVESPAAASSDVMGSVYIYGNAISNLQSWDDAGTLNHHDGVHMWSPGTGVKITAAYIYNNILYGNFGANFNSGFYFENFPVGSALSLFNNVVNETGTSGHSGNGYIAPNANTSGGATVLVANNTILGPNTSIGTGVNTNSTNTVSTYNNIVGTIFTAIGMTVAPTAVDYQDYYSIGSGGWTGGSPLSAWVAWCKTNFASTTGCDADSITGNPNLNGSFVPTAGSPVISAGINLHTLCNGQPSPGIGALCYDATGVERPPGAAWSIGAYQYTSGVTPVNPPTQLTAVVH